MQLPHFINQLGICIILYLLADYSLPKQSLMFFSYHLIGFRSLLPLLALQALGISQNLKGNQLKSANSE